MVCVFRYGSCLSIGVVSVNVVLVFHYFSCLSIYCVFKGMRQRNYLFTCYSSFTPTAPQPLLYRAASLSQEFCNLRHIRRVHGYRHAWTYMFRSHMFMTQSRVKWQTLQFLYFIINCNLYTYSTYVLLRSCLFSKAWVRKEKKCCNSWCKEYCLLEYIAV
jgi:hypothetical protein